MRWSKLKRLVESRFADAVADRISIHSAAYGNCTCGHCWITLDKKVIANFCTRAYYNRYLDGEAGINPVYEHQLVLYGELSRQDAYQSMFSFIHDLSIAEALKSDDVLVQALAVLDSRIGKRTLNSLNESEFHPLAQEFLRIRRHAERVSGAA